MSINWTTPRNWMNNNPAIGALRIDELILPGSHDSGFDKQSPHGGNRWEVTQDVSPARQIDGGIRVLDLRVQFFADYQSTDPRRFSIFHNQPSGRTVKGDILDPLHSFYDSHSEAEPTHREVIILDFHEFKDFTEAAHQEFRQLLSSNLQARSVPYTLRELTVQELWQQHPGKTVVLAYNRASSDENFWPGVEQRWSGKNLNSTSQLKKFMDSTLERKKPEHALVSIQCAKYVLPLVVPDDFSNKIDSWFASVDERSYIQNFYIINTDWALRSAIVRNCAHASLIRAAKKA